MDAPEDNKELDGIARSIDELFSEEDAEEEPVAAGPGGDQLLWEEVDDRPSRAKEADPAAFRMAIARFIASEPSDREGQAVTLRDMAGALRDANQVDPLGDAIERLALGSGSPPDDACLAMADQFLSVPVAARLAARLGAARDDDRRVELIRLCKLLGHDMAVAVSDALADTTERFARRSFMEALVAMGESAMGALEEMVEDGRWFAVRNAVDILGQVGGDRAVELITGALAHEDGRVRREAILALAHLGGEDAGMLVYGKIEDPDPDVRRAAAMAAGALRVERALKPLMALLDSEDDNDVLIGVLQALGQLEDPGAVNAIEKHATGSLFSRPPSEVRIAAYRALARIGTPHAKKVLGEATEDKDAEVREAVRSMTAS